MAFYNDLKLALRDVGKVWRNRFVESVDCQRQNLGNCAMRQYSLNALRRPGVAILGLAFILTVVGISFIAQGVYIKAKAVVAQVLLDNAWERALKGEEDIKPWPWADTKPLAKLSVPRLGESAVVLEGVSGEAMAFGPGHVSDTPLPGKPGTAIIAGHRDTHFKFLKKLTVGDRVDVTTVNGQKVAFEITDLKVVHFDASGIDPEAVGTNLVLVTCWPFDSRQQGPLRFVVEAEKADPLVRKPVLPKDAQRKL